MAREMIAYFSVYLVFSSSVLNIELGIRKFSNATKKRMYIHGSINPWFNGISFSYNYYVLRLILNFCLICANASQCRNLYKRTRTSDMVKCYAWTLLLFFFQIPHFSDSYVIYYVHAILAAFKFQMCRSKSEKRVPKHPIIWLWVLISTHHISLVVLPCGWVNEHWTKNRKIFLKISILSIHCPFFLVIYNKWWEMWYFS